MDADDRQFLFTTAWLFARHGQQRRARALCEVLAEDDPKDGVAAAALAELLLADGEPAQALSVLQEAVYPAELRRAAALLESRALTMLGRRDESERRWKRYVAASQGATRNWIAEE